MPEDPEVMPEDPEVTPEVMPEVSGSTSPEGTRKATRPRGIFFAHSLAVGTGHLSLATIIKMIIVIINNNNNYYFYYNC